MKFCAFCFAAQFSPDAIFFAREMQIYHDTSLQIYLIVICVRKLNSYSQVLKVVMMSANDDILHVPFRVHILTSLAPPTLRQSPFRDYAVVPRGDGFHGHGDILRSK